MSPARTIKLRATKNARHVHLDMLSGREPGNLALCGHLVLDHEDWQYLLMDLVAGHGERYQLIVETVETLKTAKVF